jgi:1,4-dihydroxy-2-naphthoate octaprenyltransferase
LKDIFSRPKFIILLLATRPAFLTASAAPILVGSAAGFARSGRFDAAAFILALFSIMLIHSGANVANDYFDHVSGNDWLNKNPTPFSGGRRFIQQGVLSAKATILLSVFLLAAGAVLGLAIVLVTNSIFIFILGLAGIAGGFFYTAPPVKLGYRSLGETAIGFLFGILPVAGAYYLQAKRVDAVMLLPGAIVGILIFLVVFINEFPDRDADAAVGKRTLVVNFGMAKSVRIYRLALLSSYALAIVSMFFRITFFAGLFYLFTMPLAVAAMKAANEKDLNIPGKTAANRMTILLHAVGSIALTTGFILTGLYK